jgi:hypothetical protein
MPKQPSAARSLGKRRSERRPLTERTRTSNPLFAPRIPSPEQSSVSVRHTVFARRTLGRYAQHCVGLGAHDFRRSDPRRCFAPYSGPTAEVGFHVSTRKPTVFNLSRKSGVSSRGSYLGIASTSYADRTSPAPNNSNVLNLTEKRRSKIRAQTKKASVSLLSKLLEELAARPGLLLLTNASSCTSYSSGSLSSSSLASLCTSVVFVND